MDAAAPLPPVRTEPAVSAVHQGWARVHEAHQPGPDTGGAGGAGGGQGWRDRLGRFVARVALEVQRPTQQAQRDDRALIGDLIRAADALAARCDTLAERLESLERSLAEVVEVLGADLVHLRAEVADLTHLRHDPGSTPPDG